MKISVLNNATHQMYKNVLSIEDQVSIIKL